LGRQGAGVARGGRKDLEANNNAARVDILDDHRARADPESGGHKGDEDFLKQVRVVFVPGEIQVVKLEDGGDRGA